MKRIPKPGEFYRHFQDKLYQIITVAEHARTGETLVICQRLSGSYPVYAEPISAFNAVVDREKYPQEHQHYCFERVNIHAKNKIPYVPEEGYLDEENDMEDELIFDDSFEEMVFEDDFEEDRSGVGEDTPAQWLERFLDAEGYEKQLEVLNQMRGKVGMRELGSICMVLDVPLMTEDVDSQISMIMRHLETRMRYDGRRLR